MFSLSAPYSQTSLSSPSSTFTPFLEESWILFLADVHEEENWSTQFSLIIESGEPITILISIVMAGCFLPFIYDEH